MRSKGIILYADDHLTVTAAGDSLDNHRLTQGVLCAAGAPYNAICGSE